MFNSHLLSTICVLKRPKDPLMKSRKPSDPKVFRRIPARYLLLGILPLSACGGGGDEVGAAADEGGATPDDVPSNNVTLTGEVVKGPVANAIVFIDYNGDGQLNAGEPSQRTDSSGGFYFVDVDGEGPIIALTDGNSVDTSSGLVIDGMRLTAPEGSSVISPLTTIMQEGGLSNAQVVAALGLPDVDLTSFNPFTTDTAAETALAVEVAAQQVSVIVRSLSSAMQEAGISEADAADLAANAIADAVSNAGSVDLTSSTIVTSAIENAVAELSSSQASAVSSIATEIAAAAANVNNIIATASDLTSSETVDAFGLIADLTTQISEAVANGGDASEITFKDIEAVNETPIEEAENSDPTGEVTITGTARQGETLTVNTSELEDADGLGAFSYQWKADGVAINGATSSTLTLTDDQVDKIISVEVSYTDSSGNYESFNSVETGTVGPENYFFSIKFDYRFDEEGFFSEQGRRDVLDEAARIWGEIIQDDFESIPAGVTFDVLDPSDGTTIRSVTLSQPIEDLLIFVGTRPSSSFLGQAGPSGLSAQGDTFTRRVGDDFRGQGPVTDFEPWAGIMTFSSTADWHFNIDQPQSGKVDLLSVALHEIAHVLGYGTSAAFDTFVSSKYFSGPNAVVENGDTFVPLVSLQDTHVAENHRDEAVLMYPTLTSGARNLPTSLDAAILADIGYSIIGFNQQGSQPSISTNSGEVIFGTIVDDKLDGKGGDDELQGNGGNDWLYGGEGNDRIFGEEGNDTLIGDFGNDELLGGSGNDVLFGGSGNDRLWGGGGNDTFSFEIGDGLDVISDFDFDNDLIVFAENLFSTTQDILSNITSPFINVFRIDLGEGNQVDVFHEHENSDFLTAANFQVIEDSYLTTAGSLVA